jgi:hypothetical protein
VDDSKSGPRPSSALPNASSHRTPAAAHSVAGPGARARPVRPIHFTPSRTEPVQPRPVDHAPSTDRPSLIARAGTWSALAVGWAIFVAWWVIVLRRESLQSLGLALGLLATVLVVSAVATTLWTWHNLRLARNGKRGMSSLYIPMVWERDTLGRPLELPRADIARSASEVRVVMKGATKAYVVVDAEEL